MKFSSCINCMFKLLYRYINRNYRIIIASLNRLIEIFLPLYPTFHEYFLTFRRSSRINHQRLEETSKVEIYVKAIIGLLNENAHSRM